MKGKERKGERRSRNDSEHFYSKGVAALVFIMLAVQFVFFAGYIIKSFISNNTEDVSVVEVKPEENEDRSAGNRRKNSQSQNSMPDIGQYENNRPQGRQQKMEQMNSDKPAESQSANSRKWKGQQAGNQPESNRHEINRNKNSSYDDWKWDRVELNSADSTALVGLPGIGPYYARKILYYRSRLWNCFADKKQLLEITGIDSTLFRKIENRIYVEPASVKYLDLYDISADSLALHPYIGYYAARGIVNFRKIVSKEEFSLDALVKNRIISKEQAARLGLYVK